MKFTSVWPQCNLLPKAYYLTRRGISITLGHIMIFVKVWVRKIMPSGYCNPLKWGWIVGSVNHLWSCCQMFLYIENTCVDCCIWNMSWYLETSKSVWQIWWKGNLVCSCWEWGIMSIGYLFASLENRVAGWSTSPLEILSVSSIKSHSQFYGLSRCLWAVQRVDKTQLLTF